MRRVFKFVGVVSASAFMLSCMQIEDLSQGGTATEPEVDINIDFSFDTRVDYPLSVQTVNEWGEVTQGILYSVYDQNPFIQSEEGDSERVEGLLPLYRGYSESGGKVILSLPSNISRVYVVPDIMGYGIMQVVTLNEMGLTTDVVLKGAQVSDFQTSFASYGAMTRNSSTAEIERDRIHVGRNSLFYTYFNEQELDLTTGRLLLPSSTDVAGRVVTVERLDENFKTFVNAYFPESTYWSGMNGDTDGLIVDEAGAKIYVTFIGDGGYVNGSSNATTYNSLYYYTYTDDNRPSVPYSSNFINRDTYRMTAVFPNVHPSYIVSGTRVQLLYFDADKGKYVETFPKGTYVGFMLNYKGYNQSSNANGLGFSLSNTSAYESSIRQGVNPYCQSKAFNWDGQSHGLMIWNETYRCYILGMERRGGVFGGDNDFNDILAKVSFTPNERVAQPDDDITQDDIEDLINQTEIVGQTRSGVLAFEDSWPEKGDYDFNDFVTDYTYTLYKRKGSNLISRIEVAFTPRAVGALYTNGFAIQLPLSRANVESVSVDGVEDASVLEKAGTDVWQTVLVYNDVREDFELSSSFINTLNGGSLINSKTKTISITLASPVSELELRMELFNPFIYVQNRGCEVHLVDKIPTSMMNTSLFGTKDDNSIPAQGIYFRMDNNSPWALDLPVGWQWPHEQASVYNAYPDYANWYKDWVEGKAATWYEKVLGEYIWNYKAD